MHFILTKNNFLWRHAQSKFLEQHNFKIVCIALELCAHIYYVSDLIFKIRPNYDISTKLLLSVADREQNNIADVWLVPKWKLRQVKLDHVTVTNKKLSFLQTWSNVLPSTVSDCNWICQFTLFSLFVVGKVSHYDWNTKQKKSYWES